MRVLHIDFEKTWRGGENQVLNLITGLRDSGVENAVCTYPNSPLAKKASGSGFKIIPIKSVNEWDIFSSYRLSRILSKEKYDVIHFHTAHSHAIGLMALKMVTRKPRVILSRRVDFAVGKNFFSRIKYSQTVDKIIAISEGVKKVLIKSGLNGDNITIVYSGVDIRSIKATEITNDIRGDFSISTDRFILGNVAALAPHKDHRTLIKAIELVKEIHPEIVLVIFGEGSEEGDLKRLTKSLNLEEYIIFAGFHKDIISYMKQFEIFVLSSNLEGLCTSLIDASACGLPIIATKTGGIPEAVLDNKTGFLAEPEDHKDLAMKLIKLIEDEDIRHEFSKNGLEHSENFDFKNTVKGTLAVYEEVLKK